MTVIPLLDFDYEAAVKNQTYIDGFIKNAKGLSIRYPYSAFVMRLRDGGNLTDYRQYQSLAAMLQYISQQSLVMKNTMNVDTGLWDGYPETIDVIVKKIKEALATEK
jgi:hypothetical protein